MVLAPDWGSVRRVCAACLQTTVRQRTEAFVINHMLPIQLQPADRGGA